MVNKKVKCNKSVLSADTCTGVVCQIANMECKDGNCVCKMGYIGDCNQCEGKPRIFNNITCKKNWSENSTQNVLPIIMTNNRNW